jgi:membrane-bound toxin of toxin-antitoxin system
MQDELHIQLSPSAYLKAALVCLHLGGFFCVCYVFFHQIFIAFLVGLLQAWHLRHCLKKYVYYRAKDSIVRFSLEPSGQGEFFLPNNRMLLGRLYSRHSYVSQYALVIAIRSQAARTHTILILKDSISPFAYQRLSAHIGAIPQ